MKFLLLFVIPFLLCHSKLFVTLTFDDAWKEHYDASVLLDSYNLKATFYCNSGRFGTNQYMKSDKIVDIHNRGHEIAGHTVHHFNLSALSNEDRVYEICQDRENLKRLGINAQSFAFPFSAKFDNADDTLKNCGFSSGRVSGGLYTDGSCLRCASGNRMPLTETQKYALRSLSYRHYMRAAGLKHIIDRGLLTTVAQDEWIIFVFHRIANFTSQESTDLFLNTYDPNDDTFNSTISIIEINDLREFLEYLVVKNVDVKLVNEMIPPLPTVTTTPFPTTAPSSGQAIKYSFCLLAVVLVLSFWL